MILGSMGARHGPARWSLGALPLNHATTWDEGLGPLDPPPASQFSSTTATSAELSTGSNRWSMCVLHSPYACCMTATLPPETAAAREGGGSGSGMAAHPVLRFVRAAGAALDRLGATPAWSMTPEEQREALVLMARLQSRMEELELRVLASADRNDVGGASGATSTAAWLATATHRTRAECSAAVRLAADLDERYDATRRALAHGEVTVEQAHVIAKAVDALVRDHDDLPPDIHERAESHLLRLACDFDAIALHRLGKRLYEVVCPEAADAAEGDILAREEEHARRTASLTMHDNGDGTVDGRFRVPVLHAALLQKALEALTSPRRLGEGRIDPATGRKLPYPVLLGHGFMDLLENHLSDLPSVNGSPFTLVVTIGLDALMSGLGAAALDTGHRISAGEARRLACKAGIIPIVLDGNSVPLDLGREQRLFDRYQRSALAQIYGGCAEADCDRPPAWTEAHHREPWQDGGRTDLANGLPLCPPHHRMADHPKIYDVRRLPDGRVRFVRRT